jgi:hypothetical protein
MPRVKWKPPESLRKSHRAVRFESSPRGPSDQESGLIPQELEISSLNFEVPLITIDTCTVH